MTRKGNEMIHNSNNPWNAIDTNVRSINKKGHGLLGLIACQGKGYMPPKAEHQAMLGKVDQMRSRLDEIERIVKTLKPE